MIDPIIDFDRIATVIRTLVDAKVSPALSRPSDDRAELVVTLDGDLQERLLEVTTLGDSISDVRFRRRNDRMDTPHAARAAPLAPVFKALRDVPGWMTWEDCAIFATVLGLQTALGGHGDILEIGCYYGRSAGLLATLLQESERLVLCDTFELCEPGVDPPSPDSVRAVIHRVRTDLSPHDVVVHHCPSRDLRGRVESPVRAIHIDGAHDESTVFADLVLARELLLPNGIMLIDDYDHPHVPGVSRAVDRFLRGHSGVRTVADVHRGAVGRKLVLALGPQ